jgi:flagellar biosynthesis protein FlhB
MDLKKLFPLSYQLDLVKSIIYYLVAAIVAGLLIWLSTALTGWIPVVGAIVGWILRIVGILAEIYVVGGIIVSILVKLDVLK